jgi:hypothetical protein
VALVDRGDEKTAAACPALIGGQGGGRSWLMTSSGAWLTWPDRGHCNRAVVLTDPSSSPRTQSGQ